MAGVSEYLERVEEALTLAGVEASASRSTTEGQWNLKRNDIEVWIDLWDAEDQGKVYFQVMSPLTHIPEGENLAAFLRELLDINYQVIEAYLVTFKNGCYVKTIREAEHMTKESIFLSIYRVGYYAEQFQQKLIERYGVTKLLLREEESNGTAS